MSRQPEAACGPKAGGLRSHDGQCEACAPSSDYAELSPADHAGVALCPVESRTACLTAEVKTGRRLPHCPCSLCGPAAVLRQR